MDIKRKISQAKAQLLVEYPYFGTIASRLSLVSNDNIESFVSNGRSIEYREEYLLSLKTSELAFIFANGAMHATLAHDMRKSKRSGWLWQMATDMAINDMLVTNGMELPYGAHYRKRFQGMYAEEIYEALKSDMIREEDNLEYETDDSDDVAQKENEKNSSKPQTAEELEEEILAEQLFAEEAIALLQSESNRGEAPLSIERFFELSDSGVVDWREELKVALDRYFRDDYRMLPPSKKLLYSGIYLPSSFSQTFRLVIVIDSSGSVDEELLNTFLSEVNFLMALVRNYHIELLVCDDRVHSHTTFMSGDSLEVDLKGYGGTDYTPAFDFVAEEFDDVKLLLYFTDLEGVFPKNRPNYEVRWVSRAIVDVPFGEIIALEA
jgi:predicted metal-dependent peptidase